MCAEMGVLGDKRGTWGHCGIGGGRGHCRVVGKPGDKRTWRQQRTPKDRGERQENGVGMLQGERRDNLVTLGAWGGGQQGWHQHAVRGHGDLSDETGVRGHMRGRDGAVGVLGGGGTKTKDSRGCRRPAWPRPPPRGHHAAPAPCGPSPASAGNPGDRGHGDRVIAPIHPASPVSPSPRVTLVTLVPMSPCVPDATRLPQGHS